MDVVGIPKEGTETLPRGGETEWGKGANFFFSKKEVSKLKQVRKEKNVL